MTFQVFVVIVFCIISKFNDDNDNDKPLKSIDILLIIADDEQNNYVKTLFLISQLIRFYVAYWNGKSSTFVFFIFLFYLWWYMWVRFITKITSTSTTLMRSVNFDLFLFFFLYFSFIFILLYSLSFYFLFCWNYWIMIINVSFCFIKIRIVFKMNQDQLQFEVQFCAAYSLIYNL